MSAQAPSTSVIRFAVAGENARSSSWRVWANPGKNNVYISCRELRGTLKVSLHETGDWHVSFTAEFMEAQRIAEIANLPPRYFHKWHNPPEIAPGMTLALKVLISSAAADLRSDRDVDVTLIPKPPEPGAVEVSILLIGPTAKFSQWPGKSMGTENVGSFSLPNGETLWVVYRNLDGVPAISTNLSMESLVRFDGVPTELDVQGRYGILVFGDEENGSRCILDMVVGQDVIAALNDAARKN